MPIKPRLPLLSTALFSFALSCSALTVPELLLLLLLLVLSSAARPPVRHRGYFHSSLCLYGGLA